MSKGCKIFWVVISLILLILLLPVFTVIGLLIIIAVYLQVVKDFLNNEFENDRGDTEESQEDSDDNPEQN